MLSFESANLVCGKDRVRVCGDEPSHTEFFRLCLLTARQCKAMAARCQHQATERHVQHLLAIPILACYDLRPNIKDYSLVSIFSSYKLDLNNFACVVQIPLGQPLPDTGSRAPFLKLEAWSTDALNQLFMSIFFELQVVRC